MCCCGGGILDLEGAWRRVDGVPETRGGQARRTLVQRAQIEVEDAVRQRPAGRHWRRRRRRVSSGGRAWSRRGDGERGEGVGGEFLRGPKWSMLTASGLQQRPVNTGGRRADGRRWLERACRVAGDDGERGLLLYVTSSR